MSRIETHSVIRLGACYHHDGSPFLRLNASNSSVEKQFRDWSAFSFVEAIGNQAAIRSFLLHNLIVSLDGMSNEEKEEWKLWDEVLQHANKFDTQDLEMEFHQAIHPKWKMLKTLREVMKLPPSGIQAVIDVVDAVCEVIFLTCTFSKEYTSLRTGKGNTGVDSSDSSQS